MKHQEETGTLSLHRMFYYILCACNSGWDIGHKSLNHQLGWSTGYHTNYSFIHSIGTYRMRRFVAVLRSFFHSSLLCTFSCHPSSPTILPSSPTSSCYLFLDLTLNLVVPKFIYNNFLGILFSSIFCTYPNQHNLFNLIVSIIVGFFNTCINFFIG